MKILITGSKGQLGTDVVSYLKSKSSHTLLTPSRDELDLGDENSIKTYLKNNTYDAVMHLGAYTNVDKAESEKELCFKVNTDATITLMRDAKKRGAKFLFISTDYVFDGTSKEPYKTFFKKNPINVYGESKSRAEDAIIDEYYEKSYIVRTSTVIGKNGSNFIKTMLSLAENRDEVNVVSDQISSPTFTFDLAPMLIKIIESDEYGLYHVCNEGSVSKSDLVRASYKLMNIRIKVNDILTKDYPTPAKRPLYSVLNTQTIRARGFELLPPWDESLKTFLAR